MAQGNRSLEIRINSVDDAKSVVFNQVKIEQEAKEKECDSIEFLVSEEVRHEVSSIIYGVFRRIRTYTSYIKCREDNTLCILPHFKGNKSRFDHETVNIAEKPPESAVRERTVYVNGKARKIIDNKVVVEAPVDIVEQPVTPKTMTATEVAPAKPKKMHWKTNQALERKAAQSQQ